MARKKSRSFVKSFFDICVVEALRAASGGSKAGVLVVEKVKNSKIFNHEKKSPNSPKRSEMPR